MKKIKFKAPGNTRFTKAGRIYTGVAFNDGDKIRVHTIRGTVTISKSDIVEKVKKETKTTAPTSAEYKLFSDTCFETAIRWRDGWKSVISGKQFKPGEYDKLHAGHFLSRLNWGSRHRGLNCHAITQGENYAMSRGDVRTINKYANFLEKTYGDNVLSELDEMAMQPVKLSISFLQEDCRYCWEYLNLYVDANKELANRIASWPTKKKNAINKVKEYLGY